MSSSTSHFIPPSKHLIAFVYVQVVVILLLQVFMSLSLLLCTIWRSPSLLGAFHAKRFKTIEVMINISQFFQEQIEMCQLLVAHEAVFFAALSSGYRWIMCCSIIISYYNIYIIYPSIIYTVCTHKSSLVLLPHAMLCRGWWTEVINHPNICILGLGHLAGWSCSPRIVEIRGC